MRLGLRGWGRDGPLFACVVASLLALLLICAVGHLQLERVEDAFPAPARTGTASTSALGKVAQLPQYSSVQRVPYTTSVSYYGRG